MNNIRYKLLAICSLIFILPACKHISSELNTEQLLIKGAVIIDGTGSESFQADLLIENGAIAMIGKDLPKVDGHTIDATGKTIIPSLICTHAHVGNLKGTSTTEQNYTRDNVLSQLNKYQSYGVNCVLALGTDRPVLFKDQFYDSLNKGLFEGALLYSAGYGFGVSNGLPPEDYGMDMVYRPKSEVEAIEDVDEVNQLHPAVLKIWVDDNHGKAPKMSPTIYNAIINHAHEKQLRVAAHVYNLKDANNLVDAGVDIIAHSIRDKELDEATIDNIKSHEVMYIPTLALDKYAYIYNSTEPIPWWEEEFFQNSLEQGVYSSLQAKLSSPDTTNLIMKKRAFQIASINLKKLYDAGVLIALGTDSGAQPERAQGFSEHLELELMVNAGLTPIQAITIASKNSAKLLKIEDKTGTLQVGKSADFIILNKNPENNIKNTRTIKSVYQNGKKVSNGPPQTKS